ncbi:hypothetical protein E1281_22220 [Actinomadura sp. KC345]|uniref:hypothetical protein n=1 Tax=Actinomadura sp. KC345 TaxID=2530371 RepID=UPI00104BCAE1|nr:hypothetical protein [Actinomadura sp. KC345]TDC50240.1 hypothetical protein E1281_22220 [Actinomadura sp. KC345]
MEFAALGAWVVAAAGGAHLLVIWLANGGPSAKVTRFPTLVVAGHPLAAVAGLAVWIGYLVTARAEYAWLARAALLVVTLQGFMLFTRWLVGRGGRHARGAEQAFPAAAVAVHGAVAVTTFVLVFLSAVDVTRA